MKHFSLENPFLSAKWRGMAKRNLIVQAVTTYHLSILEHLVIQGQAIAEVKSTGPKTEMGKIGTVLQKVEEDETRLKKEISQIVRNMAIIGLTLCILVIVVYGFTRLDWIDGFLAGITLAMAIST